MSKFKNRQEFEEWAYDQFRRYGIRQPDIYLEDELMDLNPNIPVNFIRDHVTNRDKVTE